MATWFLDTNMVGRSSPSIADLLFIKSASSLNLAIGPYTLSAFRKTSWIYIQYLDSIFYIYALKKSYWVTTDHYCLHRGNYPTIESVEEFVTMLVFFKPNITSNQPASSLCNFLPYIISYHRVFPPPPWFLYLPLYTSLFRLTTSFCV